MNIKENAMKQLMFNVQHLVILVGQKQIKLFIEKNV